MLQHPPDAIGGSKPKGFLMEQRTNLISVVLGRRKSGKTWYTINRLIPAYRRANPTNKVIVLDTLDHPSWRHLPSIKPAQVPYLKPGTIARIVDSNPDRVIKDHMQHLWNSMIVFEDAAKYLDPKLQDHVVKLIGDSKQMDVDLVFMFHFFKMVPPRLIRYIDFLVLHKTDDPVGRKTDLPDYAAVEAAYRRVMQSKDEFPRETIDLR